LKYSQNFLHLKVTCKIVHGKRTIEEDLSKTIMPGPIMPYTFMKHKPIRQEGLLLHLQILVLGLSLGLP
jgi:hypothetical protein